MLSKVTGIVVGAVTGALTGILAIPHSLITAVPVVLYDGLGMESWGFSDYIIFSPIVFFTGVVYLALLTVMTPFSLLYNIYNGIKTGATQGFMAALTLPYDFLVNNTIDKIEERAKTLKVEYIEDASNLSRHFIAQLSMPFTGPMAVPVGTSRVPGNCASILNAESEILNASSNTSSSAIVIRSTNTSGAAPATTSLSNKENKQAETKSFLPNQTSASSKPLSFRPRLRQVKDAPIDVTLTSRF